MKIEIASKDNHSALVVGVILIKEIDNRLDDHTIPALLRAEEGRIAGSLDLQTIKKELNAKGLARTYLFEMFKEILTGRDIQRQNPLLDLCNLTSLRYRIPVAPIALNPESKTIKFDYFEGEQTNSQTDAPFWRLSDELSEIYNSRDGRVRATDQVTPQTKTGLIILSGSSGEEITTSSKEIITSIERLLRGRAELIILNPTQSEVELELP